jgi:hypothetical protein
VRDLVLFGAVSVYETFMPIGYQDQLSPMITHIRDVWRDSFTKVEELVEPMMYVLREYVISMYKTLNDQSQRALNPLVDHFTSRFPRSRAFIGPSLMDRLLLMLWMLIVLRVVYRILVKVFTPRRKRIEPPHSRPQSEPSPGDQTVRKRIVLVK